ncbi:MAG: hypothetical protein CMB77_05230 [Euryarchaeota archaeon]|nr:hypothetical protein [Euryarchaeota archaeon]
MRGLGSVSTTGIEILPKVCFGCGACIMSCPAHAISLIDRLAEVELNDCTGCDFCVPMCPVEAIFTISLDE